jgi:hypothetical protein
MEFMIFSGGLVSNAGESALMRKYHGIYQLTNNYSQVCRLAF